MFWQTRTIGNPGDDMRTTWKFAVALLGAAAMGHVAAEAAGKAARDPADAIAESTVRAHMEFLASDAMNGRGSGTRDEWIAATYIASQLRRSGLRPLAGGDFVQQVEIERMEAVGAPMLRIDPLHAVRGEQMLVMHLSGAEFRGPLQKYRADTPVRPGAALLMPQDALPDGAAQLQSAGLVLWHESQARRAHWNELSSRTIMVGRARIAGVAPAPGPVQNPPSQIMLADDAYAAISQLEEGSMATLSAVTRETLGSTWNAAAMLPGGDGREKDDIILLSAHLDHLGARDEPARIYNGADDDASGSTAVLALAEALAKSHPLKRTVVFAWFGSEEAGGYGARYFVDKPVVPLDRIVANLEFEMIGRPDPGIAPHTLWLTGWGRTNLGPELAAQGARLVADPHPAERFFTRSDNFTLARRGVIAQTVSSFGLHADYHQPSDKISRIDFGHMTESIQSMLAPIRWLADSGFKPDWVQGGRPATQ